MTLTIFLIPSGTADLLCLPTSLSTHVLEWGWGLSKTTQKNHQHPRNEMPGHEGPSLFLHVSNIHLHSSATGSWQLCRGHSWSCKLQPKHADLCWPLLTPGFDDRLGLLCSSAMSRWRWETKTMEGNIKDRRTEREACQVKGQAGQLSDECNCEHIDLWLSNGTVCHVSWCYLCLE